MPLRKLLLVLIASTAMESSPCAAGQQLRTSNQIKSEFQEHTSEFEAAKTSLLATESHSFCISVNHATNYAFVPSAIRLPAKSFESCKKLMKAIDADDVVRVGNTIRFRICFKKTGSKLEEQNIVFDAKREHVVPKKESGVKRVVDDLGAGWLIVSDQIDLKTFNVNP